MTKTGPVTFYGPKHPTWGVSQGVGDGTYYRVLSYDIAMLERRAALRAKITPASKSTDAAHLTEIRHASVARHVARNLCVRCGEPWEGRSQACRPCLDRQQRQRVAREGLNRSAGICSRCGEPRDDESFQTCGACREKNKAFDRTRTQQQRAWAAAGKCSRCGGNPLAGRKRCRPCANFVASQKRAQRAAKKVLDKLSATN